MKTYTAPDGAAIKGTLERIYGTAEIEGFDEDNDPIYSGSTEIDWDSQATLTRNGKALYIDENGNEWTFDQLVEEPEEEDEPEDEEVEDLDETEDQALS